MKCSAVAVIAMLLPNIALAQLPGTNVVATPRLRSLTRVGDTTIVSYSVLVSPTSVERLIGFSISVAVPVAQIASPGPDTVWMAASTFEGHQVAAWFTALPIAQGDSTPTLVYKAIGLPLLSTAWLTGDSVLTYGTDNPFAPAYEWLDSMSARTTTAIGMIFAPLSQPAVSSLLQGQTDAACTANWITSSSLCTALHGLATTDYSSVQQYGTTLDSARTAGSAVSDEAYWLLHIHQAYALAHTTPPPLSAYITVDTATSIFTAHPSGGTPEYSYLWEWCAIDCGGGEELRAPPAKGVHPEEVEHGWHDVGYYTDSICWSMSESTLRLTVTDGASNQVVTTYTVPLLEHVCSP